MNGADKALLQLAGEPLLAHAIARLRPQVTDIVISANGDLSRLASFGVPVALTAPPNIPGRSLACLPGSSGSRRTGPTFARS